MTGYLTLLLMFAVGFVATRLWLYLARPSKPKPEPVDIAALEHEVLSPEFIAWLGGHSELNHPEDCAGCKPSPKPRVTAKQVYLGSLNQRVRNVGRRMVCEDTGCQYTLSSRECIFCGEEEYDPHRKNKSEWASIDAFLEDSDGP